MSLPSNLNHLSKSQLKSYPPILDLSKDNQPNNCIKTNDIGTQTLLTGSKYHRTRSVGTETDVSASTRFVVEAVERRARWAESINTAIDRQVELFHEVLSADQQIFRSVWREQITLLKEFNQEGENNSGESTGRTPAVAAGESSRTSRGNRDRGRRNIVRRRER